MSPEYLKLSTETSESALDKFLTSESCFQEGRDKYYVCNLDFSRRSSCRVGSQNTSFEIFTIAQDEPNVQLEPGMCCGCVVASVFVQ